MKILKIILPFFPNNEYLQQHWWHRLAIVIAITVIIPLALFLMYFQLILLYYHPPSGAVILALLMGYIVSNAVLTLIYRAILYITTGNEWKKSKISKND